MIGCDRHKVAQFIFEMKVYHDKQNNPFLAKDFKPRFEAVKRACNMHDHVQTVKSYTAILERSIERLKNVLKITIANYPN